MRGTWCVMRGTRSAIAGHWSLVTMIEIETERLRLRQFRREDLDALAAIYADPEVMRYMGTGRPATREQTQASVERFLVSWATSGLGLWAVEARGDGGRLGHCGASALA